MWDGRATGGDDGDRDVVVARFPLGLACCFLKFGSRLVSSVWVGIGSGGSARLGGGFLLLFPLTCIYIYSLEEMILSRNKSKNDNFVDDSLQTFLK